MGQNNQLDLPGRTLNTSHHEGGCNVVIIGLCPWVAPNDP